MILPETKFHARDINTRTTAKKQAKVGRNVQLLYSREVFRNEEDEGARTGQARSVIEIPGRLSAQACPEDAIAPQSDPVLFDAPATNEDSVKE